MKKIFLIFLLILTNTVILAEEENTTLPPQIAGTSYIQGAYDSLNSVKQDKLDANTVISSGTGGVVTSVTATDGTVTVTKEEVTLPVGSYDTPNSRARIWIQ